MLNLSCFDEIPTKLTIQPTVSIGNVPQLASDLIIHTFKLERVGFLDDDSVMPVSGVREDTDAPGTTVPIEGRCRHFFLVMLQ